MLILCLHLAQSCRLDWLHILADVPMNIILFGTYPFNLLIILLPSCTVYRPVFVWSSLLNPLQFIEVLSTNDAQVSIDFSMFRKNNGRPCSIPVRIDFIYSESCWHLTIITPTYHSKFWFGVKLRSFLENLSCENFSSRCSLSGCCPVSSLGGAVTTFTGSGRSQSLNCNLCFLLGFQLSLTPPEF